jgi:hypothetical protein
MEYFVYMLDQILVKFIQWNASQVNILHVLGQLLLYLFLLFA